MGCIIGMSSPRELLNGVACELQERIGVPGCVFIGGASAASAVGVQGPYYAVQELQELHCGVPGGDEVVEEGV